MIFQNPTFKNGFFSSAGPVGGIEEIMKAKQSVSCLVIYLG